VTISSVQIRSSQSAIFAASSMRGPIAATGSGCAATTATLAPSAPVAPPFATSAFTGRLAQAFGIETSTSCTFPLRRTGMTPFFAQRNADRSGTPASRAACFTGIQTWPATLAALAATWRSSCGELSTPAATVSLAAEAAPTSPT
jgi:hypothetical protein